MAENFIKRMADAELDKATKKRIKNEYKQSHKLPTKSELNELYNLLALYRRLSRAKGKVKLSRDRKSVEKLSVSWVVRLERLIKCKSLKFKDWQAEVDGLYAAQTELYRQELKKLVAERASISEEEVERQQEEYDDIMKMIYTPFDELTPRQREKIYLIYKQIRQEELAVLKATNSDGKLDDETMLAKKYWSDIVLSIKKGLKEPRYITIEDDIKWLRQKIAENKRNARDYYRFAVNRKFLFENYDRVRELISNWAKRAADLGKKVELIIDDDGMQAHKRKDMTVPYNYSKEEMEKLEQLSHDVDNLYFSEFSPQGPMPFDKCRVWTYDEVRDGNYTKNKDVSKINYLTLSPFEKMLLVHHLVTKNSYSSVTFTDTQEYADLRKPQQDAIKGAKSSLKNSGANVNLGMVNLERARTLLTSAKSKDSSAKLKHMGFVCSGFTSRAKAYIDTLNDPNIKCEYVGLTCYSKKTGKVIYAHSILRVSLTDDKYGIKGEYIWDPTWDCDGKGYAFCLFPLEDYLKYKSSSAVMKIELSDETSNHNAIINNNLPDRIDPNDERLVLDNSEVEPSPPIPFETFDLGLKNMFKQAHWVFPMPDDFVERAETDTVHNLYSFDPEQAKNAFYANMREYYSQHIEKYPDWQKNFTEYNREINYTTCRRV